MLEIYFVVVSNHTCKSANEDHRLNCPATSTWCILEIVQMLGQIVAHQFVDQTALKYQYQPLGPKNLLKGKLFYLTLQNLTVLIRFCKNYLDYDKLK